MTLVEVWTAVVVVMAVIPRTVMVHLEDTLVADRAVVSPVWFDHVTVLADPVHAVVGPALDREIAFGYILVEDSLLVLLIGLLEQFVSFSGRQPKLKLKR